MYFPGAPLSAFIKQYLVIESDEPVVNRIMPDTSLVLSVCFRGKVRFLHHADPLELSPFTLSGLRKSNRVVGYEKGSANLLVVFQEAAARAFVREPLHELCEQQVPLQDLDNFHGLSLLTEQLAEAANHRQRIDLVEQYLLAKLHGDAADPLVAAAIGRMHAVGGVLRIKELARSLYISQDAFEKRFRRVVGISPKQFAYIIKMRSVVRRAVQLHDLSTIAFDAGYYDLPHFNKDFKLFTGVTPTAFLKDPIVM